MKEVSPTVPDELLDWCTSVLGPVEVASDNSKAHGEHESTTCRLHARNRFCYLKTHQSQSHWNNEVHAYERWASSFGRFAPRLLAVREKEPLALVISELPGQILEKTPLPPSQEQAVWRNAGAALVALHNLGTGKCFGPCLRDGTYAETSTLNASEYVSKRFKSQMERAIHDGYIGDDEITTLRAAYDLIPAFEGERPIPCHRDYCAANWLINEQGAWTGVIDFEFAYWDVRVADFSRDPNWSWIHRPDLVDAFVEGYARSFTAAEEQQLLVAHSDYALGAILWGHDHSFHGFEQEGHEALAYLASLLK